MSRVPRQASPAHWPYHLNAFDKCPQKYYLKYVRKLKGRIFARPEMTRGNITHQVLAHAFKVFAGRRDFPADLRAEIDERVGQSDHITSGMRASEVLLIQDLVDGAIDTFDRTKSVHTVECVYSYPFRGNQRDPAFTAKARVDLVVRIDDGEVEHIDWKTGKRREVDEVQTVAARLAIGKALDIARVRSTTAFFGTGEADSRILSKDDARRTWIRMREIAREIDENHASGEWVPIQSGLCVHCEYYQHGCRLHAKAGASTLRGSE